MPNETSVTKDANWHLDKRVPIALFIGLALQFAAAGWWASNFSQRLVFVEADVARLGSYNERLIRLEAKMEAQTIILQNIATKIGAL